MSYTFRMIFSGLFAFVPNRLAGDEAAASSWSVLIPELTIGRPIVRPIPGDDNGRAVVIPPHFPGIVFPSRFLNRETSTKDVDLYFGKPEAEEWSLALFKNERLLIRFPDHNEIRELKPDLRDREADVPPPPRAYGYPDLGRSRWSLRWLTSMKEMLEGSSEVSTHNLFDDLRPQEGTLAGHVLLDNGSLYTHSFARPGRNVSLWRFEDPETAHGQVEGGGRPVAYTVALEILEAEGPVELRFERSTGLETITRSLMLVPGEEDAEIEVTASNREFEEIVGLGEGTPELGQFDQDVEIYHTLSSKAHEVGRKLPRLSGSLGGGLGGERLTCGEVEFSGFDVAFVDRLAKIEQVLQDE